jgi:hypothetical protein
VRATAEGLTVGCAKLPVVNLGDALFHIAKVAKAEMSDAALEEPESALPSDPSFDDDEII